MSPQQKKQWLVLCVVLAALLAAVAGLLAHSRARLLAHHADVLRGQVRMIEKHLGGQLVEIARSLESIGRYWMELPAAERLTRTGLRVSALASVTEGVRSYLILDADGRVVVSSQSSLLGADLSYRGFFKDARSTTERDRVFLTAPFHTMLRVWTMTMARPVYDRSGEFAGVVVASLEPDFFDRVLTSANFTPDTWSAVGHGSGVIYMHRPHADVEGKNVNRPGTMMRRHFDSGQVETVMDGVVAATGEHRYIAQRNVRPEGLNLDHGLMVAVSRDYDAVLASWRQEVRAMGALALLAALIACFGLAWVQRAARRHQQVLEAKQALFDRLTRLAPGVISQFSLSRDGTASMPYASDAIGTIFGVTAQQAAASAAPLFERIHPQDVERVKQAIEHSAVTLQAFRAEFRVCVPGQPERWVEVHSIPQRQPDGGTLWDGYIADVSERHAVQQARVAKEAAERASIAKSEFMSRMSHELRTPLNAILGFAQLLEADIGRRLGERERAQVEHILKAGNHLLLLIDDLLDLSRIESGAIQVSIRPLRVQDSIDEAVALAGELAQRADVKLVAEPVPGEVTLCADPVRLRQVLFNLLSNAIKYNHPGGLVKLTVETAGEQCAIAVIDNGIGMNESQLAHLFEPFNRLGAERGRVPGTGIGLSITRKLVELMGGTIEVESTPGAGSTFRVRLPAVSGHPVAPVPAPNPAPDAGGERLRVLYAHRSPGDAELVRGVIRMRPGVALALANSGEEAVALASQKAPDIVLVDLDLEDAAPAVLLARLRDDAGLNDAACVALSAEPGPQAERSAREAGFHQFLGKPIDLTRLLAQIDARLHSRAH